MIESLVMMLIYVAIIGLVIWAITSLIPMPGPMKTIVYIIGALIALLLLLKMVPALE